MDIKHIIGISLGLVAVVGVIFVAQRPVEVAVTAPEGTYGALSGPDIPSLYLKWGAGQGIRILPTANALTTGTTTVCSILSPAATSTLRSVGVQLTTSTTTSGVFTIAKGNHSNASTTLIAQAPIVANAPLFLNGSTTADSIISIAPNTYINFSMSGGAGTFSPVGVCHATFEEYL